MEKNEAGEFFLKLVVGLFAIAGLGALLSLVYVNGAHIAEHPGPATVWEIIGTSRDQWLVILTATLAAATYLLFKRTSDLSKAAAAQFDQAERHNEIRSSGILILTKPELNIFSVDEDTEGDYAEVEVRFAAVAMNVGAGAALSGLCGIHIAGTDRRVGIQTLMPGQQKNILVEVTVLLRKDEDYDNQLLKSGAHIACSSVYRLLSRSRYHYLGEGFFREMVGIPQPMEAREDDPELTQYVLERLKTMNERGAEQF